MNQPAALPPLFSRSRQRLGLEGLSVALALAGALTPATPGQAAHDGSHLARVSTNLVTPHLVWARPLAGGPVRVLFIVPRNLAAREVAELAQRCDLDFQAVTAHSGNALAADDIYEAGSSGTSPAEKSAELLAALERPVEVIVLANLPITILPAEAQYRIVRHVADGGGLLTTFDWPFPYQKMLATPQPAPEIAAAVGFAGLPPALQKLRPERLVCTYTFAKGRVARLAYPGAHSNPYGAMGLTASQSYHDGWMAQYENNMALVAQTLLWAAGRVPSATLRPDAPAGAVLSAAELLKQGLALRVTATNAAPWTLALRLRDAANTLLDQRELTPVFSNGVASVTYRPPCWPHGTLTLDAVLHSPRGVEAFGAWSFAAVGSVGAIAWATDRPAYEAGQPVQARLTLAAPAPRPLRLVTRLDDLPYGQTWTRREVTLAAGATNLTLTLEPPPHWPTSAGLLVGQLFDGDQLLGEARSTLLFPQRDRPLYTSVGWDGVPEILAPPFAQQLNNVVDWHFSLQHPSRGGANGLALARFDQRLVPYMTRIGLSADAQGRTLTDHWLGATKEEIAALGDDQSFYNPAVQALWERTIERRLTNLPACGPLVYNLGDENHFSYDAGYAASDLPAYRGFLQQRYGDIATLNREWQTNFVDFAGVPHATPRELREGRHTAATFAHRAFMEQQYADNHHFLAQCIRARDPYAQVGAEGSVPGDLELTLSKLDFWGPYSDPVGDELLRSVAADKFRTLWWGGYVGSHGGRDIYPFPLWRPLLQGSVNGSAWFSVGISSEGFFAADLTFADYFQQLLPHLHRLQRGLGQLLVDQPLRDDGLAILWSHASASAAQMIPQCHNPRDGAAVLLDLCYRRGLTADFVTTRGLAAGALDRYRFLLLPGASALSVDEIARLRAFVARGGILVADLNPGVMNEHCRLLPASAAAALFGAPAFSGDASFVFGPREFAGSLRGRPLALRAGKCWSNPQLPASSTNAIGEGLAILLNFSLGAAANTADPATPMESFLLDLLALAEIRPAVTVGGLDPAQTLLRLRRKGACTTIGLLADKASLGKPVTLDLPQESHVYRADGGAVGRRRRVTFTLDSPLALFCCFASKPDAPVLRPDRRRLAVGESLTIDRAALDPEALYRLEVIDPAGVSLLRRLRVFAGRGSATDTTVRWAFNDAPGRYTLVLTDIRTGLQAPTRIGVSPENSK